MIAPAYKDKPKCYGDYPFSSPELRADRVCSDCRYEPDCEAVTPTAGPIPPSSALATQVGGGHYKDMKIQPLEYCHANNIGKIEGDVIAYVSRWRKKNGIEDLKKARHELDILIELETRNQ